MTRKWFGLVILVLGALLSACRAEDRPFTATPSVEVMVATVTRPAGTATTTVIPTPSATPTRSATATAPPLPTPSAMPTRLATATTTPPLTPSATATRQATATATALPTAVTPIVRVEGVAADGTCVALDDSVTVPAEVFRRPDFEIEIQAYLNAGGAISGLPAALAATELERAIRIQLVSQDATASGVPDLFIGLTLPYAGGDGETHLLFFTCVGEGYRGEVLFRRAGAGSRMEGLYEGGGVDVGAVRDLNGNGRAELFFSVNWPGYGEHFVLEWEGEQFVSLIEYQGMLGETRYWIESYGQAVEIVDVDGDGVHEIVVGEAGEGQAIWRWDGERYSREPE